MPNPPPCNPTQIYLATTTPQGGVCPKNGKARPQANPPARQAYASTHHGTAHWQTQVGQVSPLHENTLMAGGAAALREERQIQDFHQATGTYCAATSGDSGEQLLTV